MSDIGSDSYSAFDFSEFTEEDFAQIDAAILSHIQRDDDALTETDTSFQSELDGLNLSSLTPEEFAQLDSAVFMKLNEHNDGPLIQIEMEDEESTSFQAVEPSPLEQFRSGRTLSVSDLVSPAWYFYLTYFDNGKVLILKFKGVKSNLIMDYGEKAGFLLENDRYLLSLLLGRKYLLKNRLLRRMM